MTDAVIIPLTPHGLPASEPGRSRRIARLQILVIDNAHEDRMAVRCALDVQGFVLAEAATGADGIGKARALAPDCILLDRALSEVDGLEVLDTLKKPDGELPCAVVMLTADTNVEEATQSLKKGALDYLDKHDVNEDSIRRAVHRSVERLRLLGGRSGANVVDDVDAERRARETLRRSERRLAAQKEALELAVSGATIDVVLKPVAEETREQVSGDARVALYIVDSDGAHLRFAATAGMSPRYTSAVDGFEIRPTNPSCGKVAFTGERIIVEDVMTDPLWEPYRALAHEHGFRACWSFPIRSFADNILGTIAVYYDSPRDPQQQDIDAVELLAQTAGLIIERHKAEEERAAAHERLRRSESRLRLALAGARAGAWEWDARTDGMMWSPEMFAIAGLASEAGAPNLETYLTMVDEKDRDKAVADVKAALSKGGPFTTEFRIRRTDGAVLWLSIAGVVEHAETGRPLRAYGIQQDITERKRHDEQVSLLSREVNHRAKNVLMLVQAIARQTAGGDPKDFVERFQRRIQALAANHDLLVRSEWRGVEIHDLVRAQLAPFADLVDTRVKISGPHLRLSAASAQAIGMALHELATNAGKYGALSCAEGCVDVEWIIAASEGDGKDEFRISWRERGGPPVIKPQQPGLGSTMISTIAKMSLRGSAELDYRPDGVRWCLTCPPANAVEAGRDR